MSNYSKVEVQEMLNARKLNVNLDQFPIFGKAPSFVLLDPNAEPVAIPGRFYTMVKHPDKNWAPLVEVSSRYKIIPHLDLLGSFLEHSVDPIQKMFGDIEFNFLMTQNCGRMFMDVTLPKQSMKVNNDLVVPYIRLGNSVDLSKRLSVSYRVTRMACTNGLMVPDSRFPSGNKSTRHIGEEAEIGTFLQDTLGNAEGMLTAIKKWEGWSEKSISSLEFVGIMDEIGFSPNQQEKLVEAPLRGFKMVRCLAPNLTDYFKGGKDSNFWVAYNAVTQFLTDNVGNIATQDEKDAKASRIFELALT